MFQMLTCFNLKRGVGLEEFGAALESFISHLRETGLALGGSGVKRRCVETHLDTDRERGHEFFFVMDFRDKAQSDAAFDYLKARTPEGFRRHRAVFSRVRDQVFICWQDA
ncbi:hypothetical protein H0I76_16455 [Limibaculum sp. M0105]|uniref:Uncharacterized protein n=1 Tax=Thermohalobaculum xanthum TaxID=2753746 RepID=A0A8J7M9S4_9RHOB|nr:DUF6614 family protein [Thermohalobaculum xanthum]MBK0400793.1 hypothetical protein [Thermohalobaculum xanthum]